MVASQNVNAVGVAQFEGKQESDGLDALLASVDIVPQEQIARVWRQTPQLENSQQVVKLAMNIAANGDGGADFQQ